MRTRWLSPATLRTARAKNLFAPRRCPCSRLLCAGKPWPKLIERSIAFRSESKRKTVTVQTQSEWIALRSQPGRLWRSPRWPNATGARRCCWALRGLRCQKWPIQTARAVLSFNLPIYVTLNRAQLAEILRSTSRSIVPRDSPLIVNSPNQDPVTEAVVERRAQGFARRPTLASVRVSPGGYLAAAAVLTFVSVICLRTHHDLLAIIIIAATWCAIPLLVLT